MSAQRSGNGNLRKKIAIAVVVVSIAVAVVFSRCATIAPLAPLSTRASYEFSAIPARENSDSLFVVLTFSGGGTRAAAFAYGVLRELNATHIVWEGRTTTLLDEVDVISSVSGGSFTAAYYGIFRKDIFSTFEDKFLYRGNTSALIWRTLRPDNLVRLLITPTNRSDVAAEYYDGFFQRATFAQFAARGRPFIVINATDVSQGAPFEFTQETFDHICADVSAFPVARAVAASSAFPVLFAPVLMPNAGGTCRAGNAIALQNALNDRTLNPARYRKASVMASYERHMERPFFHLIDGGVADNLGIHVLVDSINEDLPILPLRYLLQSGQICQFIVIAVDAGTETDTEMDQHAAAPSAITVVKTSAFAPMGNYSLALLDAARMKVEDLSARGTATYFIHLSFDDLADRALAAKLKRVPTSLSLPKATVNALRDAGQMALRTNPQFQALLKHLK